MRLPHGHEAIVTDDKLYQFLVNRRHPRQSGHAELFDRLLGIDDSNAERLRHALLEAAANGEAVEGKPSLYGQKFEIRFPMTGPRGEFIIISVWIIEYGQARPKLVTAFVE